MQGQGPQLPGAEAGPQAGQAVVAPAAEAGPQAASSAAQAASPSAPQPATTAVPQPARTAATTGVPRSEVKVFRLPGAAVAWWTWVIFAVACGADVAATGRNHTAAEIAATLVLVTGVLYACALRPRVIADSAGLTVMNPLRDHRIPWGSVAAVDLKESVQVHCVREPGAKRGKVVHSWALYSQRRSRLRSELMSHNDRRRLPRSSYDGNDRAGEAQKISRQPAAQIMATQLEDMVKAARNRDAAPGPRVVTWDWRPAAAMLLPAVLLVLVITVFR
ncbi:MAG TPA: PH domain-containing protein [Streptosporangiaceae bacterium]|nr:PH domain-containing protein [Streptosporangiaceae bacterium]